MALMETEGARQAEATRMVLEAAFSPWGGSEACIDAYEAGIRATTNMHLTVAKTLSPGPARTLVTSCADVTRDLGATQISGARWLLDV